MEVSVSLLAGDLLNLSKNIKAMERAGANRIHVDIMDGHYVDNFTFGPDLVRAIKQVTNLEIEVHLEVNNGDRHIANFAKAGADMIILQADAISLPIRALNDIKNHGVKTCFAINPTDSVKTALKVYELLDMILILAVEPGFGGQTFNASCLDNIRAAKLFKEEHQADFKIAVDGGINEKNIAVLSEAGVQELIIGTAAFKNGELEKNIEFYKNCDRGQIVYLDSFGN